MKDSYPLPSIDQLVDATSGHELLTFMDAFSGYNQIQMVSEDEEKAVFITNRGLFCYRIMPFSLKNVGATYQCLVNNMFKHQIDRNMKDYIDDILVKSKTSCCHMDDLKETFATLRKYQMKLNLIKCTFDVISKKNLGFLISSWGVEANRKKIKAIQDMSPSKIIKEVQSLTRWVAALNRFVSKSAE